MLSLADLRPGDIAFGPIHGFAGNCIVGPGQILVSPWKDQLTWRTWWRNRHVGVIVAEVEYDDRALREVAGPKMAQAMPHGAEVIELGPEHWTPEWTFIRPRYVHNGPGQPIWERDVPTQAVAVAVRAGEMAERQIPYNWLDYQAIVNHRLRVPGPWLDRYVAAVDSGGLPVRAICSQLADAALTLAGFQVFADGRKPGDVIPSELYLRLLDKHPAMIIRPGVTERRSDGLDGSVFLPTSVRERLL